jgi:hypothetical protein
MFNGEARGEQGDRRAKDGRPVQRLTVHGHHKSRNAELCFCIEGK